MPWNDDITAGSAAYEIAASTHKRIRVLAGPGAGKSFAMKRRVARLLEIEGVGAPEILAVTFTRVAAEDLHRELASLGVPGADTLRGRTLHSLAMSILMRNHVLLVLGRKPRPLNEYEMKPLISDLTGRHGGKRKLNKLIKAYAAAWARLQADEPGFTRSAEDQAFVDDLVGWLVLHEAMLMDEVIPYLFQYLRGNPGAAEIDEYSHLLVDEYQDLNRAEQASLAYLGQKGSMCVIGDDDQSIYSFRHAHPDGIREWPSLQPTEEHAITECRRCPTTVVRMANALIARNTARSGTAMNELAANGAGEVVVRQYSTAAKEAEAVAEKIATLTSAGVAPGEIIVLAQRKTFADPVFHRLRELDIPAKSYYAEADLDTIDAQERFALLKLTIDREDRVALRWLLGRGRDDWFTNPYRRVLDLVGASGESPWAVLSNTADGVVSVNHTAALVARFKEIRDQVNALAVITDLDTFVTAWLPPSPGTELLAETVAKYRVNATTPSELYNVLYEAITQPEIPLEIEEVRVMSLHKSKGLSSPYVFVVGAVEGLLPGQPDDSLSLLEQAKKLEEDRRVFYVGITRVKARPPERAGYLGISYPKTMIAAEAYASQIQPVSVFRNVASLQPSRFLVEMAPHAPAAQFDTSL